MSPEKDIIFWEKPENSVISGKKEINDPYKCMRINFKNELNEEILNKTEWYINKYKKEWWGKFFESDIGEISKEPYLTKTILDYVLKENTRYIFEYDYILRTLPYWEEYIRKALGNNNMEFFAKKDPEGFIIFTNLKFWIYCDNANWSHISDIKRKITDNYSQIFDKIKNNDISWINKNELITYAKKNPERIFVELIWVHPKNPLMEEFIEIAISKESLTKICNSNPSLIFSYSNYFAKKPYMKEIFKLAATKDPIAYLGYQNSPYNTVSIFPYEEMKIFNEILLNEESIMNWLLRNPYKSAHNNSEFSLAWLVANKPYFAKYIERTLDFDIWIWLLIIRDPEYVRKLGLCWWWSLGRIIRKISLNFKGVENDWGGYLNLVKIINNLHEEKDELRFLIIENFNSKELYNCVVEWREEIFTSSFNWILKRLNSSLEKEGKDYYDLFASLNFKWVAVFLEAVSSYGQVDKFLNSIKKEKLIKILNVLVSSIKSDLKNSIAFIDIVSSINDKEILKYIGNNIKLKYKDPKTSTDEKNRLWIIGKKLKYKFYDPFFTDELSDKYTIPKLDSIKSTELFDKNNRNIQQYFFYNDDDGRSSFENFLSNYKNDKTWKIEDHKTFIIVKSDKTKDWKQINIFANKPESDKAKQNISDWIDDMNTFMKNSSPSMEPTIIVHRWHSYHTKDTINKIPPSAKMVFLGSCWGFQNISLVLDKAKNTHIISTKWTWTKFVNDPLFREINDSILSEKEIIWKDIWDKSEKRFKWKPEVYDNFLNYVRPDENLWALLKSKLDKFN